MGDRQFATLKCVGMTFVLVGAGIPSVCAQTSQRPLRSPVTNTGEVNTGGATSADPGFSDSGTLPATSSGQQANADGDGSDTSDDPDASQDNPLPLKRGPILDGDDSTAPEPEQPPDGIVEVGEPLPVQDGVDPLNVETREPEDIAAFANPPAGYDPLLFQIEDIDPVRDNRTTARLFRLEPFDPVGIRIGSFVLFPELEVGGSWYSNALQSPDARSDKAGDVRPAARLVSNWTRHALEFRATGGFSYYDDFTTENDESYTIESRGRLDFTRRTNVQALISRDVGQESRSALDANAAGERTDITTDRAEIALNHRFNRLSLQFRGSVAELSYGDVENLGIIISSADRDYTVYEETARASWAFKPAFSAFAEVAVNQRRYDEAAASDLINRSSDGQRYRAGLSFGNTGQILRGEISVGYGVQNPDDASLAEIDGVLLDANASWRISELTSVLFNAQTDVTETTTANVGGAFYRSAGITVRHALRRYLIASAGLTYTTQNSHDGVIDENELRSTAGVEYFLNAETILFGTYNHIRFDDIGSLDDYDANEVRIGLRLRR